MGLDSQLGAIESATLAKVVRRALGSEAAVMGAWDATHLHGGVGAASGGVYLVAGVARDAGGARPWSLILKLLRAPAVTATFGAVSRGGVGPGGSRLPLGPAR